VLGVGGLVESATTPTIRNAEESGRRLINDAGAKARRLLEQANRNAVALQKSLRGWAEPIDCS
jgi:vacuolar-type H+-ATPase subunit H